MARSRACRYCGVTYSRDIIRIHEAGCTEKDAVDKPVENVDKVEEVQEEEVKLKCPDYKSSSLDDLQAFCEENGIEYDEELDRKGLYNYIKQTI